MAEENNEQNTEQLQQNTPQYYVLDANGNLAARIDKLFYKWFDKNGAIISNNNEQLDTTETLNELTKIVNSLLGMLSTSKEKPAADLFTQFNAFLSGDSTAAVNVIGDRPVEDHISKIVWLINVATTVSVLSGELAETKKNLDKGPLKKAKVNAENVEKVAVPIKNSKQMKSVPEFIGNTLPAKFQAVSKHKNLAKAAERRSRFTGTAKPGEPHTIEQMYTDIGEALIYVSTGIFAEANRAFTEQGKRLSADKIKNLDFKQLSAKEQDKLMQTLYAGFIREVNYTAELSIFSCINDKMILDSALAVWYNQMNEDQKARSGFKEQDLYSLPKAIAFSRKFKTQFDSMYLRYSNRFVDGITAALKKEQETVEKDWFENKITGEKQYRRGRLAGHGNKFMHTAPMKWLNEGMSKKSWASLWAVPKLAMLTLNIMTNPTLRKMRKKLTGTLFAGIRSFAQGVAEGFTSLGSSTEITYDEVIKKIKEAEAELKKITSEDTYITNESVEMKNLDLLLEDEFSNMDDPVEYPEEKKKEPKDESFVKICNKIADSLKYTQKLVQQAMADESLKSDRNKYEAAYKKLTNTLEKFDIRDRVQAAAETAESSRDEKDQALIGLSELLDKFDEDHAAYTQKAQEYNDNAHDAEHGGALQVGEKTVAICEDVFDTLNKYIARQWNLLAAHSNDATMPLCVNYVQIELKDYIKAAAKKQTTSEMTFTDWLEFNKLFEDANDEQKKAEELYTHGGHVGTPKAPHRQQKLSKQAFSRNAVAGVPNDERTQQAVNIDRDLRDKRNNINHDGKQTAEYPKKLTNGMYQYHGLEVRASSADKSKTGFGVLADRLIKIADPVAEFCQYVEALGHDDAKKTFDNDSKDGYVTNAKSRKDKASNANLKASNKNPLESVFVTGYVLNEDIGNRIVTAVDKATDKVGDASKSLIKKAGKGTAIGLGKAAKWLVGGGDSDPLDAKTGLTYMYDRTLNTAYIRDGANILKKHCLINSAEKCFESIATLAQALKDSDIANARSISSVSQALHAFKQSIGQTEFAPCKSIIDYELADKINNGGIADNPTDGTCMIKGICIRGYDSAKNYSSGFSDKDKQDIFATSAEDARLAASGGDEELSNEETSDLTDVDADNKDEVVPEDKADEKIEPDNTGAEPPSEEPPSEETAEKQVEKTDETDVKDTTETKTDAQAKEAPAQQPKKKQKNSGLVQASKFGKTLDNAQVQGEVGKDAQQHVERGNVDTRNAKQLDNGTTYSLKRNQTNGIKKLLSPSDMKMKKNRGESIEVDISDLSALYEQINNIDWKESLNG